MSHIIGATKSAKLTIFVVFATSSQPKPMSNMDLLRNRTTLLCWLLFLGTVFSSKSVSSFVVRPRVSSKNIPVPRSLPPLSIRPTHHYTLPVIKMTAEDINGKEIAQSIRNELKEKVAELKEVSPKHFWPT